MAGFVPNEGETLRGKLIWKRDQTDRDADLELGLFTNVSPGETITHAALTEPTGGGYARKTLTDASWSDADASGDRKFSYAQQTFQAAGGAMSGSIQGYFIATKAAGGTKRILAIEVDPNGPYSLAENAEYKVALGITEQ